MAQISENEFKVLKYVYSKYPESIPENAIDIPGLSSRDIASAISYLEVKGLIRIDKNEIRKYYRTAEGDRYCSIGLPEHRLYRLLKERGKLSINDIQREMGDEYRIALAQIAKFGITPDSGYLYYRDDGIEEKLEEREEFLKNIENNADLNPDLLEHFKKRKNVIEEKRESVRIVSLTDEGIEAAKAEEYQGGISEIDSEMLSSGRWKGMTFRKYDLNAPVNIQRGALKHPLTYLIKEVRDIFIDMGFTEMTGNYIEYALWDMDSLFIPQDHPARDLQDTFYVKASKEIPLEDGEIEKRIKRIHEKGTGKYSGWGYRWSHEKAMELVLRTHTTVNTARYLYGSEPPQAIFSVEKVFRHESVDWKHLAEFHQIEGAVYDRNANVSTLKWMIRNFYSRIGFKSIRLIPSYYPYTEPSIDVIVNINGREVELGGSGILRPEVNRILGLRAPVIAWGLGLERLAMMYYDLTDIRQLYNSDFDWLQTYRIH